MLGTVLLYATIVRLAGGFVPIDDGGRHRTTSTTVAKTKSAVDVVQRLQFVARIVSIEVPRAFGTSNEFLLGVIEEFEPLLAEAGPEVVRFVVAVFGRPILVIYLVERRRILGIRGAESCYTHSERDIEGEHTWAVVGALPYLFLLTYIGV